MVVNNPETTTELLNLDIDKIIKFNLAKRWLVIFNPIKTETLIISRKLNKPLHPSLFMDNKQITEVEVHKHLNVFFLMTVRGMRILILLRKRHGKE